MNNNEKHFSVDDAFESLKKANSTSNIAADIYAQLQSQMVRKKRDAEEDSKGENTSVGISFIIALVNHTFQATTRTTNTPTEGRTKFEVHANLSSISITCKLKS